MLPLRICQSLASEERAPAVSALSHAYQPAKHTHAVTLSTHLGSADRYLFKAWLGSEMRPWQKPHRGSGHCCSPLQWLVGGRKGWRGLLQRHGREFSLQRDVSGWWVALIHKVNA